MAEAGPVRLGVVKGRESEHISELTRSWRRFTANRMSIVGGVFVVLMVLVAIFADVLAPFDPTDIFPGMRGVGLSAAHPLGFDHIGRDLLSRVIHGARVSLTAAFVATVMSVLIGVIVGATAGFFGGWVDSLLSRVTDTLMAFPLIALLIVLAAVLGPSLPTTIVVIGATVWARYARVVRADVMSLNQTDFVTAARAAGVKDGRIIFRHIMPNVIAPVIVLATLGVGGIIILEAALSFLGLGVRPPGSSWGGTLADGRAFITMYPHIAIVPGVAISLTVLAFNLFGNGLRDALDPRIRG